MKNFGPFVFVILASSVSGGWKVCTYHHNPPLHTTQAASFADLPGWQVFQDPQLEELIRTALKQNYDMQLAAERIKAERAQLAITRSYLFPQVQGSGDFTGGKEKSFQSKSNFFALT